MQVSRSTAVSRAGAYRRLYLEDEENASNIMWVPGRIYRAGWPWANCCGSAF